jgi:hypothetical protein
VSWGAALGFKIAFAFIGLNFFLHSGTPLIYYFFFLRRRFLILNCHYSSRAPIISFCLVYFAQRLALPTSISPSATRLANRCGRVGFMTHPYL